jgi:hypothetical protein
MAVSESGPFVTRHAMKNGDSPAEKELLEGRMKQLDNQMLQLHQQIEGLKAEKERLYYQIGRLAFDEKEWENFDPSEYTVSLEEILEVVNEIKE